MCLPKTVRAGLTLIMTDTDIFLHYTVKVPFRRMSRDDAPTRAVNVPCCTCHPWLTTSQMDTSRSVSGSDTTADSPADSATWTGPHHTTPAPAVRLTAD